MSADRQSRRKSTIPDDAVELSVELDVLRRVQLTPERTLVRCVRSATSKGEMDRLMQLRGYTLVKVKDVEITADRPLEAVLEVMDRGDGPEDQNVSLVFTPPIWPGSNAEERRQEENNLFEPKTMITDLTAETLLAHLYIHKRRGRAPVIKDLANIPRGMKFYFNHPFWNMFDVGALLQLKPTTLTELDLSNNALTDVGAALSRFDNLTELRLEGNRLTSLELHHMPCLKELWLSSNQLRVLPELLGMPVLQKLDLGENLIGSRVAGDGIHDEQGGERLLLLLPSPSLLPAPSARSLTPPRLPCVPAHPLSPQSLPTAGSRSRTRSSRSSSSCCCPTTSSSGGRRPSTSGSRACRTSSRSPRSTFAATLSSSTRASTTCQPSSSTASGCSRSAPASRCSTRRR